MDQKREIEFEPLTEEAKRAAGIAETGTGDWYQRVAGNAEHPDPNVDLVYALIESATGDLMRILKENVPEGRELAIAKTHLATAALWALAGVARQKPYVPVLSSAPGG